MVSIFGKRLERNCLENLYLILTWLEFIWKLKEIFLNTENIQNFENSWIGFMVCLSLISIPTASYSLWRAKVCFQITCLYTVTQNDTYFSSTYISPQNTIEEHKATVSQDLTDAHYTVLLLSE